MPCRFVAADFSMKQHVGDKQHNVPFLRSLFQEHFGLRTALHYVFVYFQGCNKFKYFIISVKCLFQKDVGIELMLHKQK
jgi:hypothetical protein